MNESPKSATPHRKTRVKPEIIILALLIAFPSTGFVQKYAGLIGVVGFVATVIALIVGIALLEARFTPWMRRHFCVLATLGVAALAMGFVILHPLEDNRGPGKSSDRDEGLELAVTRLTHGQTPYYPSNTVAGPLSILPGSIILAAPFVALGKSGYQNIFWLGAFLLAACHLFKDKALALCLLLVPLALSPAEQYEFISGGDLIANGVFAAILLLFAVESWSDYSSQAWHRWLACLLLGIGLASRANFIMLVPIFGGALWRMAGARRALIATSLVVLITAVITLPFYLNDPAGFTPLLTRDKLAGADKTLPWASTAMIGITTLTAITGGFMLMFHRKEITMALFFRYCTIVTLAPMACVVLLSTWVNGHPDFSFMRDRFGLMYLFFALLGWGGSWFQGAVSPRQHLKL
jgi:hypothetical protein